MITAASAPMGSSVPRLPASPLVSSGERGGVQAKAAAGHFRAIALWLNQAVVGQGIYAQVQAARPGCLLIRLEYERAPDPDQLTRLVCHRIWQLHSPLIEGIHLSVRPVGSPQVAWERRVRILPQSSRRRPTARRQVFPRRPRDRSSAPAGFGSPRSLAPKNTQPRSHSTSANLAAKRGSQAHPTSPRVTGLPPQLRPVATAPAIRRPLIPPQSTKAFRALLLTGSAVAAFIMGCWMEILLSAPTESSTVIQQQATLFPGIERRPDGQVISVVDSNGGSAEADWLESESESESGVVYGPRSGDRPHVIQGALEPLAVIAHDQVPRPTDPTVTLVFGGQVDFDSLPYSALQGPDHLLSGVTAYQRADVAMVSLNTSLSSAATSLQEGYIELQRPDAVTLLQSGGVDLIDLAGENTMAFGEQGLVETLETLDRHGVYRVGAGRNEQEARRPEVIDVKGQRIAYLSYNQRDLMRAYGNSGGINALVRQALIADIQAIRPEVDWLVVNYRWSETLPEQPADWQTNLAHLAIDQGADVVVGHHPTQLQGAEIYQGRPIAYSLGNFIFDRNTPGNADPSASGASVVLQVSLGDRQMKVDMIPVQVRQGRPYQVEGPEAEAIWREVYTASQDFPEPMAPSLILDTRSPQERLEEAATTESAPGEFIEPSVPAEESQGTTRIEETEDWGSSEGLGSPGDSDRPQQRPEATGSSRTPAAAPEQQMPHPREPVSAPMAEDSDGFAEESDPLEVVPLEVEDLDLENWGPKALPGEEEFIPIPGEGEAVAPPDMTDPARVDPEATAPTPGSTTATPSPRDRGFTPPAAYFPTENRVPEDPIAIARRRLGQPQVRIFRPAPPSESPEPRATTL